MGSLIISYSKAEFCANDNCVQKKISKSPGIIVFIMLLINGLIVVYKYLPKNSLSLSIA